MAMNLTVLYQDPETGVLRPVRLSNVDVALVEGLWIPCNGSTTPWMTHLGSEEYEPNGRSFEKKPLKAMNLYLGIRHGRAKAILVERAGIKQRTIENRCLRRLLQAA